MQIKLRVLQAATVLLYMGPLLAGLAGYGWTLVPAFALIFSLGLAMSRPHQFPQSAQDWQDPQAVAAVLVQVVAQVLLVILCLGIGRGIGGVMGYLPMVHGLAPVVLSFIGLMLMRWSWDSSRALDQGITVDDLLYPVKSNSQGAAAEATKG